MRNYNGGNNAYSGVKRAVLLGINYALNTTVNTLDGCINDAMAIRGVLIDTYQYKNENVNKRKYWSNSPKKQGKFGHN